MTRTQPILLILLTFALTGVLSAQETETAAKPASATATATTATATSTAPAAKTATTTDSAEGGEGHSEPNIYTIRNEFTKLIEQQPPQVGQVLAVEPNLLLNSQFTATYPDVVKYMKEHPEIANNPRFYTNEFRPLQRRNAVDEIMEGLSWSAVTGLLTFAFIWLVRTIIEQRRWSRLSKIQTEVHNKILDRFASSEEVLQYIKSPAGSKFLESAPIPLREERVAATHNAPLSRIMWSIQIGVVIAIASFGMLLVSLRLEKESSESMFALGAIGFCVGAGFVASAVISLVVSRRLGLWQGGPEAPPALDDTGGVR
jgi:hypothetical protein